MPLTAPLIQGACLFLPSKLGAAITHQSTEMYLSVGTLFHEDHLALLPACKFGHGSFLFWVPTITLRARFVGFEHVDQSKNQQRSRGSETLPFPQGPFLTQGHSPSSKAGRAAPRCVPAEGRGDSSLLVSFFCFFFLTEYELRYNFFFIIRKQ